MAKRRIIIRIIIRRRFIRNRRNTFKSCNCRSRKRNGVNDARIALSADSANVCRIFGIAHEASEYCHRISHKLLGCRLTYNTYFPELLECKRSMAPAYTSCICRRAINYDINHRLARLRRGEGYRVPRADTLCTFATNIEIIGSLMIELVEVEIHGRAAKQGSLSECCRIKFSGRKHVAEVRFLLFGVLIPSSTNVVGIQERYGHIFHWHTAQVGGNGRHCPLADTIIMTIGIAVRAYVDIILSTIRKTSNRQAEAVNRILRRDRSEINICLIGDEYIVISYIIAL